MVNQDVFAQIEIIPQAGDFCTAPMVATINGPGTAVVPVTVDCHTIGTDYGEFNPTLTCPAGAATNQYKTSWYRLDITGADTLDVTVFINENTNASSTDIKYRMMTGNCGAMQEQSCVQDALTRNTYKCLAPGNSYYIQVMTPIMVNSAPVTGTIDLNIEAVIHADTCLPASTCIAVANFSWDFDCTRDQNVRFINNSTYGSSITNFWDFGYNNQTSNAVSPSFFYPALTIPQTYTVKLVITNTTCSKVDSVIQTITIPARPAVNLGRDTIICTNGATLTLNATSHTGATYYWFNGSTLPAVTLSGVYPNAWVEITYNGCKARDTISVLVNPIAIRPLQTKALCNVSQVTLDAYRGNGEQYLWSTGALTSSIVVSQPGYYWVDLYWQGCFVRDSFRVISSTLNPLGSDTSLCQSRMPYTANATVNGATSYSWQNNSTNSTFLVTQPGLYWVDILIGGCTYRDTIIVAVDSFHTVSVAARICQGQTYTLPGGGIVNTPGIYYDSLRNIRGCDSLITTVTLVVDTVIRVSSNVSICAGQTYTLPSGTIVNTTGNYTDTVRNNIGCDSLITNLSLTVQTLTLVNLNPTICSGNTYTLPSGTIISNPGIYIDTLRSVMNCDSLITTVDLNVLMFATDSTYASFCFGNSYTLPWGAIVNTAGTYHDTLRYTFGCDSLRRTVILTMQNFTTTNSNANICFGQSYTLPWGAVVNTAGIYRDTLRYSTGCDSIRRIVNLTVQNFTTTNSNANICFGQTYTLPWGTVVNTAGIYRDTLRYATGCDSIRRIVNLTVQNFTTTNSNANICIGQTYTLPWGAVVNTAGIYRDTLRYSTGCDSIRRIVNLTVQDFTTTNTSANICFGQTYTLPWGAVVNTAGTYRDTLRYSTGCDSIRRIINLTVQNFTTSNTNANICFGQTYTLPWGAVVNTAGVYRDTLRYATGCDSIRRIVNLTVQNFTTTNSNANICIGQTYTLPWGAVVNTSGIYSDTLRYTTGCDSIRRNVNLTVQNFSTANTNAYLCSGMTYTLPWGTVVNSPGVYRDTLYYTSGCDSIRRTVNLILQNFTSTTINANICFGQTYTLPWGAVANTAGVYSDTLRYISGCDSIRRTVNLAVQNFSTTITSAYLCAGKTYTLPWGTVVSSEGTYRDTLRYASGCDSLRRTVVLTQQNFSVINNDVSICTGQNYTLPWGTVVNTAGVYKDTLQYASGCDSIRRSVTITIKTSPVAAVSKSNDVNCTLGTAKLMASNGVQYAWTPAASLSNAAISNPIASPTETTLYRVTVTGANGCIVKDSILVRFDNANTQNKYLVPSAFTPNNDGINDCFGVSHWGSVTGFNMIIFNRYGEKVFSSNNPSVCWDGTFKGVKQNTGAFVYIINANGICGPIMRKGTVLVIR